MSICDEFLVLDYRGTHGTVYKLPISVIVEHRVDYLVSIGQDREESFSEVVELFEEDTFEIMDWLLNNMDYEDFGDELILVDSCEDHIKDYWRAFDDYRVSRS